MNTKTENNRSKLTPEDYGENEKDIELQIGTDWMVYLYSVIYDIMKATENEHLIRFGRNLLFNKLEEYKHLHEQDKEKSRQHSRSKFQCQQRVAYERARCYVSEEDIEDVELQVRQDMRDTERNIPAGVVEWVVKRARSNQDVEERT